MTFIIIKWKPPTIKVGDFCFINKVVKLIQNNAPISRIGKPNMHEALQTETFLETLKGNVVSSIWGSF